MNHIRETHEGTVGALSADDEKKLGITACAICDQVFVTSTLAAHQRAVHGDDAGDFERSDSGESTDTTPVGGEGDEIQEAGGDGETRGYDYWEKDLYFGRLRPIREVKGEEAVIFAKMSAAILQACFLTIHYSDHELEKWAAMAFNLCPKLLGCGNKGERIKLMNIQIEKSQGDDQIETLVYFFEHTLPACEALAALAKNKKSTNIPNGYFSSNARTRAARRRLQQNASHKANKNKGTVPGNHVLTAANITGEISLPVAIRMQKLMRRNMLGKAVQALEDHITHKSTALRSDDITEDVRRQLEALHPHEAPLDEILAEEDYPCAMISEKEVFDALTSTSRGSAVAFSPWTYELLSSACRAHAPFLTGLTELLQHMLSGTLIQKDIWLSSRLIPLLKPNGKIRPIAIGEVFYRLVGRVITRQAKDKAEILLAPTQLGIGVSDGIGIAVHTLHGMTTESLRDGSDKVLVCLDIEGAFNNMYRKSILASLKDAMPEYVRLFMWAYAEATELRESNGNVICMSASGVKQGDAGGGLFFNMTFTEEIHKVVEEVKRDHGNEITAVAIHDDTYLWGSKEAVIAAFNLLEVRAKEIGLSFNRQKCKALRNAQNADIDAQLGIPGTSDGIIALGVPIGTTTFMNKEASDMFAAYGNVLGCIADLPAGMAIPILAGCVNGRPTHLLRALEPDLVREIAVAWDKKMDAAIAQVCMAQICEGGYDFFTAQVRGLTTSRGGLGIKRLHILSYDAYLASFWRAGVFAKKHMPLIWDICLNNQEVGSGRDASDRIDTLLTYFKLPASYGVRPGFYFEDERSALKQSALTIVTQDVILAALLANKDFSNARKAILISAGSNGSAAFVYFEAQNNRLLHLPTEVYREAIRLRLTLPGIESDPGFRQSCPCSTGDKEDTAFHGLLCNVTSGARTIRHDRIVKELARFITWCNPTAKVEVEVWLNDDTRADIRMTLNGKISWIDVSIVAPHGVKYIAKGSNQKSLVAAKDREEAKKKHYAPAITASTGAVTFVPFVLEITGAMGHEARKFVDDVANITTAIPEANEDMARKRRFFKKQLGAYLAIGNEHCLRVSRQKMHAVRRQRIDAPDSPLDDASSLAESLIPPEPDREIDAEEGNLADSILHNGSNNQSLPPERGREAEAEGGNLADSILNNGSNHQSLSPERGRETEAEGGNLATILQQIQSSISIIPADIEVATQFGDPLSSTFGQDGDNAGVTRDSTE